MWSLLTLFGPTHSPFTLRWQTARIHSTQLALIVTVVTLLPLWAIKSRTLEVCGNLLTFPFTSLMCRIIILLFVLRLPPTATATSSMSHIILLGIGALMENTTRGPCHTDLSLRSILSDVSPFGPCSPDNHQRDQTNHRMKHHASCTVGSSDRRRSPSIFSSAKNDIRGNYNADNN